MKLLVRSLLTFVAVLFLVGCATQQTPSSPSETQQIEKKEVTMAPEDSDKDGVIDSKDKCPGTPLGARVSKYTGCWTLGNVLFDFNKSDIRAVAQPMLNEVVIVLEKNPNMTVKLDGHCDNVGSAEYNQSLSTQRANAIKKYIVNEGIASSRIKTQGFGFDKPAASNDTAKGRALNRRVEVTPKR